jgi:hypothetical protein
MTPLRVVGGSDVHYLDTPLQTQLHKPNRFWQPRRHTGVSPDTRRTHAVAPGRRGQLPVRAPLRTVRESFPSYMWRPT